MHGGAFGGDGDAFGNAADLERDVANGKPLGGGEHDPSALKGFEAGGGDSEFVLAGIYAAKNEVAIVVGGGFALGGIGCVGELNLCAGDGKARGVASGAGDVASALLGVERGAHEYGESEWASHGKSPVVLVREVMSRFVLASRPALQGFFLSIGLRHWSQEFSCRCFTIASHLNPEPFM